MSGHLDLILLCCGISTCVFILIILLEKSISIVLYKFKKDYELLKEDNELLKKQVEELIEFKLKLQEKNKIEYNWLNTKRTCGTELYDSDQELIKWYACPDFTQKRVHENTIYDPDRAAPLTHCPGTFLEVLTKPTGTTGPEVFWNRWFKFHMDKLLI